MVTYILDRLRYREGALAAVWMMLGATNFGLIITTVFQSQELSILSFLIALSNGLLLFLIGGQACNSFLSLAKAWQEATTCCVVLFLLEGQSTGRQGSNLAAANARALLLPAH